MPHRPAVPTASTRPLAFVSVAGLSLLFVSCGSREEMVAPPVPAETAATLKVERRSQSYGSAEPTAVIVNGTRIGYIGNGETKEYQFAADPAGNRVVLQSQTLFGGDGKAREERQFDLEPGGTFSVEFHYQKNPHSIVIDSTQRQPPPTPPSSPPGSGR